MLAILMRIIGTFIFYIWILNYFTTNAYLSFQESRKTDKKNKMHFFNYP